MGTKPQEIIPDLTDRTVDRQRAIARRKRTCPVADCRHVFPSVSTHEYVAFHFEDFGHGIADDAERYREPQPTPTPPQLQSPQLEPERSSLSRDFSGKRYYWAGGTIGGEKIQALPDTGAEYNSISPTLADRMGLKLRPGTATQVRLPSRRIIQSPGSIQAPFKFVGERRSTLIDCLIIPGCVHDLILSHAFLHATRTLTKFVHRIKSTLCKSPGRLRLNLLGGEGRRLQGFINNTSTLALPDTGSNIILISESFAASQAMRVDRSASYYEEVEFANGSRDITSGIVRRLKWTFGSTQQSVVCDFYVLNGLPVDIILSSDFLFEFQVFFRYGHCMVQYDLFGDVANLCNINLIRKLYRERIEQ
ncbi:hypothetical protein LZ31DRAFT_78706 [Colletotrichum somersetense]|nr:hypothetical protein LZ31DRAFT_78706 [Colletotrichum somersetense]